MANSTSNIDAISVSQASKEVTANAFFDAASQAATYGRRASTSSGLTWGYYGGNVVKADGATVQIANGTLTLTASATSYIVAAKATGAVSAATATTNWDNTTDYWRLYSVVCGASTVTNWSDVRAIGQYTGSGSGGGGSGIVESIIAGAGISVDSTDPSNPVVSANTAGSSVATESSTSLTATAATSGNYTRFTNAGAKTYTFDSAQSYDVGAEYHARNVGAGNLTLTAAGSFALNPPAGGTLVVPQGGTVTIKIVGAAEADVMGYTEAAP